MTVRAAVNLPDLKHGEVVDVDGDDPQVKAMVFLGLLQPIARQPMPEAAKPAKARKAKSAADA
jgi:hypothetical protein